MTSGRDLKAMKYNIPSKVRIANHWYKVILCDFIDNGEQSKAGNQGGRMYEK